VIMSFLLTLLSHSVISQKLSFSDDHSVVITLADVEGSPGYDCHYNKTLIDRLMD